ncbi:ribosome hibernation-promoting factor, HPF/YfiA family [Candidatus Rariloculus sp.]|uniref:ribosome hibernation-promoting factor, HPF/YfiA family n=1 Tax=Candidatus Rariloculus sp. TaxID=3101265 RepID=UPI003D102E0D
MQLTLTGHHIDVSPALREYVDKKIARIERHFDNMTDIHCVLTVEKLAHKAEATIHLRGGTIHADSVQENMYAAIDGLVDKLNRQVKRRKEKMTDHHARNIDKPGNR